MGIDVCLHGMQNDCVDVCDLYVLNELTIGQILRLVDVWWSGLQTRMSRFRSRTIDFYLPHR